MTSADKDAAVWFYIYPQLGSCWDGMCSRGLGNIPPVFPGRLDTVSHGVSGGLLERKTVTVLEACIAGRRLLYFFLHSLFTLQWNDRNSLGENRSLLSWFSVFSREGRVV